MTLSDTPIMTNSPSSPDLKIMFVSTMAGSPWGGSEVLWHGTAKRMRNAGHPVAVSVFDWAERPAQIQELAAAGCDMMYRSRRKNAVDRFLERRFQKTSGVSISKPDWEWLQRTAPDLVVISQGYPLDGIKWMLACHKLGIPYSTVVQAAGELWWPADAMLDDMIKAYSGAEAVCFVSHANRRVVEIQCGMNLPNAHVICNPWNGSVSGAVPWPVDSGMIELACVGRMDPKAKGHDVLLQVLAMEKWKNRPVRLNLYGHGPCEKSISRLATMLGVTHVKFHGRVSDIGRIWAENHALVLPSRYEGLPLVIVEAMLCARPVITTNVAGNAEYLTEGANGFIAAAPTVPLLDEAMERAWAARGDWEKMGNSARSAVLGFLPEDPYAAFESCLVGNLAASHKS
jgi:glycosyltransferase involved in cell wall biosynthesis